MPAVWTYLIIGSPISKATEVRERDDAPEKEGEDRDADCAEEGAAVHVISKRGLEPDYSGCVDEYCFTPLTPSLEDALEKMTGGSLVVVSGQ